MALSASATADLQTLPQAESRSTPPPTEVDWEDTALATNPSTPQHLEHSLLRLRKTVPWLSSYSTLVDQQQRLIAPLFPPTYLLHQHLVQLPPDLITSLNGNLRDAEARPNGRPQNRHGVYLAEDEPHGLLMKDMSARGAFAVEIKPKWLAQSPDAPRAAQRCRTCALYLMRYGSAAERPRAYCPLDLACGVDEAVEVLMAHARDGLGPSEVEKDGLAACLQEKDILGLLRDLQVAKDPRGVLSIPAGEVPDDDFLVAMTLRDFTLYIRVDEDNVECVLGDLDIKEYQGGKLDYWKETELSLIQQGWYTRHGLGHCRLERSVSRR